MKALPAETAATSASAETVLLPDTDVITSELEGLQPTSNQLIRLTAVLWGRKVRALIDCGAGDIIITFHDMP